jgi:hypothetical protein
MVTVLENTNKADVKIQVLWDVSVCVEWVIPSVSINIQGEPVQNWLILRMKALLSFKMVWLQTLLQNLNLQQHYCGKVRSHKTEVLEIQGEYFKDDTIILKGNSSFYF